MRLNNRILALLFIGLLIGYCAGAVKIVQINENPRRYHDQEITLSGYVDNVITLPILGIGVYQLDDGTGKIWVKPAGEAPYKGDRVKVTGIIKVGLAISNETFGLILIEKEKGED